MSFNIDEATIKTVLGNQFASDGHRQYIRKKGTEKWVPVAALPSPPSFEANPNKFLFLMVQAQVDQRDHWALQVSKEGEPGTVYQVVGDHELMQFSRVENLNLQTSKSFRTAYILGSIDEDQAKMIDYHCRNEQPPSAPNRAAVTENCQRWIVRVLKRLGEDGVIKQSSIGLAESILQPMV